MHLAHYLGLLHRSQEQLAGAFRAVADAHADEPDVFHLAREARRAVRRATPSSSAVRRALRRAADDEPDALHSEIFGGPRDGPLGLLRDLHDLYLMAAECDIAWTLVGQAAQGARDDELLGVVTAARGRRRCRSSGCARA